MDTLLRKNKRTPLKKERTIFISGELYQKLLKKSSTSQIVEKILGIQQGRFKTLKDIFSPYPYPKNCR